VEVIPSIDIMHGRCVKLVQGNPSLGREVSADPLEVAERWRGEGARRLHIVDLDAALRGGVGNRETVERIIRAVDIPVQVGGGVRSVKDASSLIEAGARWVVLGTVAFEDREAASQIISTITPQRAIIAIDAKGGLVVKRGWVESTPYTPLDAIREFEPKGVAAFLYTDVHVEGMLKGVDEGYIRTLTRSAKTPIIYSGGVSSTSDIRRLAKAGVGGVILGRALYDGVVSLREAMEAAER